MAEIKSTAKSADVPQKAAEEPKADSRPRTIDADEKSRGWTVQGGPKPVEPEEIPGNVVTLAELPDPEVQKAAGIDPASANAGLVVAHDEDERVAVRIGDKAAADVDFGDEGPVGGPAKPGRRSVGGDEADRDPRPAN